VRLRRREAHLKNFEFLLAAYLVVWGIFMLFETSVARRVARLEQELDRVRGLLPPEK